MSVPRKEAPDKVRGAVKYNDDLSTPSTLHGVLVTSPQAHARIVGIDTQAALAVPGVLRVLTGDDADFMCGEVIEDRPPLAKGKVRYCGEPVAIVVALTEEQAAQAAFALQVEYEPLPVVNSPRAGLAPGAPLIHEGLGQYKIAKPPVYPEPGSNVADRVQVRKGNMEQGWAEAEVVVTGRFFLPQIDHAAMETRSARAEFRPDGRLIVHTTSQAPFEVQRMLATYCKLHDSQVVVNTPLVGGAFGGKAVVHMEPLAALASQNLGGRLVRIANTREQDITSSPVAMGLECDIRLGARRDGTITAMQISLLMDAGAYTDSAPRISRAMASDCTGPYNVPNLYCDSLTVYTNHPYTTAYRGFGHAPLTTCVERMLDKLAFELGRDPIELRRQNALRPGDVSPTGVSITRSNLGDPDKCLERVAHLLNWSEGQRLQAPDGKIRAKGIALFWKTSSSPPDAISGAVLSYNSDGSVTLRIGAVEFGAATKTTAVQILAERLGMSPDRIGVHFDVNTQVDPEHWKTVASMSTFMVGRAVLEAAEDAIRQIKSIAAIVLRCAPGDLAVSGERAFLKDDPTVFIDLKDIGRGYKYDEGHGIGGQIIGRGCYIMRHLTPMDRETGAGKTGPAWTPGAQGVEVEYDPRTHHYRLLRAVSVIDAGRVVNPMGARGVVMGGMCMGLGYGSRECLLFDEQGRTLNDQLRVYKMMRYGEQPEYTVEFVETPQQDSPFGARGIGEHGVIGMPAALANALSAAVGCDLHVLPLTPERIWRTVAARPTEPAQASEAGTTEPVRLGAAP